MFNLAKKIKIILGSQTILSKDKKVTKGSPKRRVPSLKKYTKIYGKLKITKLEDGLNKTIEWYKNDII